MSYSVVISLQPIDVPFQDPFCQQRRPRVAPRGGTTMYTTHKPPY